MTDALKEESRQMTKPDGEVTAEDARRAAREMLRRGATPDHLTTLARSCGDGSDVAVEIALGEATRRGVVEAAQQLVERGSDGAAAIRGVAESVKRRR